MASVVQAINGGDISGSRKETIMAPIAGRILIADDNETFCDTTAELLRDAGYECDCASDAAAAAALLAQKDFDLLIADIRMPGNESLELIRNQPQIAGGLPVILITGYPTVSSAIDSIHLSVSDYLVKPIELEELLDRIRKSIASHQAAQAVRRLGQRLEEWRIETSLLEKSLEAKPVLPAEQTLRAFARLAYGHAKATMDDVKKTGIPLDQLDMSADDCPYLGCTRLNLCLHAIKDTVMILERTKASFRSKELGQLRSQLQQLLVNLGEPAQ